MVFWHHLYQILSLKQSNAKQKKTQSFSTQDPNFRIHNSYFILCFKQKGVILDNIKSCFQTLEGSVACYHSAPRLSVIWQQISRLFLQKGLPRLSCIVAQTPTLLRRLWPRWNASTNTQPLHLFLCLSLGREHILTPCLASPWSQKMGTHLLQALCTLHIYCYRSVVSCC